MIFSSLFKTKANWQHKDAAIRIIAINDELSIDNPEQQQILIDIIKQDANELVRRAALIKVASFDCYLAESNENSQEKVKQFSAKQVHDILAADHQIVLSHDQKQQLLVKQSQCPVLGNALLEAWLAHEQDSTIMIGLYKQISAHKISRHLLTHTFSQKQNAELQAFLLNQVTDEKVLEKLIKKACNEDITEQIQSKLSSIQDTAEKPQKLTKQIQLVLAKLQALKDVADYGVYKKRKSILIHQWQSFENDLAIFSSEEIAAFNEKYQSIMSQLEKLFIAKAENYQQQIIADKLAQDKQQEKKLFTQQLNHINQALTTAVFSSNYLDDDAFKNQLHALIIDIEASVLNKDEQEVFVKQVKSLTQRLGQIPEIAESVSQATHLISKISELALPKSLEELNARQESYNEWLKAWRVIENKTAGILPSSIVDAHKQIVNTWQGGLKSLQGQQKDIFFQHKKKLQDIKRLLNNGKYKVCFGLFKGVKATIHQLSAQQQQLLQRDFDQVSEKIAELTDWEHYIATPRKQELLVAIQALVETPLDNPNEQAAKVKQYRNTWNSLGHADEDVDKQLNEQFNQLCEQAFSPCRLFYAEQDKLREQHLTQRQQIIVKATSLVDELKNAETSQTVNFKQLDAQLNSLQHQWKNAGEVDRKQYKKLQQQFKMAIAPVKDAINAYHQDNITEKQALISKAQALLNNEDVFSAIESIKQLQKNWREIGFAGNYQENLLWQTFRDVNDQLFAKRQELKSEQQLTQSKQQQAFDIQLSAIEQSFNAVEQNDNNALDTIKQSLEGLLREVIANKPVIKAVAQRTEKFVKNIEDIQRTNSKQQRKQSWLNLFELFAIQAEHSNSGEALQALAQYSKLTVFWQKRLQEHAKLTGMMPGTNRFDKTIEVEIMGQVDSPKDLAEQRMKLQVQLMQDQMISGGEIDLNKLLVEWLMLGPLNADELPLIKRLQVIYCQ